MPHNEQLSERPHRKLTTILAADVVGYSRMMGANEDGTYALLGKCRKIIDRNIEHRGGRIFNTAGDSVMAEFGSTVEAVRCAIEIQEEIVAHNANKAASEQMWFRIGINVGDVIIEGNDLIGDGVNIASRMESIATPSGICISGSVYELVHNKLSYTFRDMGKQSVKNIIEPVTAYSLLPARTPQITPDIADKPSSRHKKKRPIGVLILAAVMIVLGAVIAATYFAGKNSGKDESARQQNTIPPVVPSPESALPEEPKTRDSVLPGITSSYFVGKTVEGVTRKKGERFVIEMTEHGSAFVTIYKINKPTEPRFADSGQWWINKDEWICFKFGRFAEGEELCRTHVVEEGREWLVVSDPAKPKWVLKTQ